MSIVTQRIWMLFGLIILTCSAFASEEAVQTKNMMPNPGFETVDADGELEGWFQPSPSTDWGYRMEPATEGALSGKRCALIDGEGRTNPNGMGNVMRKIDATPYRGKMVRFSGAVRVDSKDGDNRAQLWFRVDRAGGKMGFFDNMRDRPIRSSKWERYQIDGFVGNDADSLALGCMFFGKGRGWIDDLSLEILADLDGDAYAAAPAAPLTPSGLANLVAFARLYGYVRYFHPSEEADVADWKDLAMQGIVGVESAENAEALAERLLALFLPIAPTLAVYSGEAPPLNEALVPKSGKDPYLRYWEHYGLGLSERSIYNSERKLTRLSNCKVPAPNSPLELDLGAGLHCRLPVSLFTKRGKSKPVATTEPVDFLERPELYQFNGDDRVTRLANVVMAWNIFQHFYPYFDVTEVDWSATLRESLAAAATDPDEIAFLLTLKRLVAQLADGHGRASLRSANRNTLPMTCAWVEDRLVVVAIADGVEDIDIGDIVTAIDGRPIAELATEAKSQISAATPGWLESRLAGELLRGSKAASVTVELDGPRGRRTSDLNYGKESQWRRDILLAHPEVTTELEPGIWYVDLDRLDNEELAERLPDLAAAKGIVFDMRGYPGGPGKQILAHLTDTTMTSAQWRVPRVTLPDRRKLDFDFSNWNIVPAEPRIQGRCAFIIDGRAISYAETCLGVVEHYRLGELVGQPTAGTNGNVNPFTLAGGYHISWTGMQVLKHDGSRHHGVGILPTVTAERSIAGIRAGRDELFEAALAALR